MRIRLAAIGCLLGIALVAPVVRAQGIAWARRLGGPNGDSALSVAVDGTGNVYSVGTFTGTADFDPGVGTFNLSSAGSSDAFVSKLDSHGNFVWAKQLGGADANGEAATGVAVEGSGNVYTVGYFWGTADFDPGPGTYNLTAVGGSSVFISKLDGNGNFVWAKRVGYGLGAALSARVALDGSGNVYIVGAFNGTADFDPGPGTYNMNPVGGYDVFILKLDSAGNFAWAKQLGGSSYEWATGVAVDGSGNVYTVGAFFGLADFDPGPSTWYMSPAGNYDVFISKLDRFGNFVWAKQLGGVSDDEPSGVAVDASGNVYTAGYFGGTANFDPGFLGVYNLTSAGTSDAFISKLDSNGNFVWAKQLGGSGLDRASGVALGGNGTGNVYTVGYFYGTAEFDPGPASFYLTSAGGTDAFLSELDASGNFVSAIRLGATDPCDFSDPDCSSYGPIDGALGVTVHGSDVVAVGTFIGTVDPGAGFILASPGGSDAFVAKYSYAVAASGTVPDGDFGPGTQLTVDKAGGTFLNLAWGPSCSLDDTDYEVYEGTLGNFTSHFRDLCSTGGATNATIDGDDYQSGFAWAARLGGQSNDTASKVAADDTGNVYTVGYFYGTAEFDPGAGVYSLTSVGSSDAFISKLDSNGSFVWAKQLGGADANGDAATGVAVDGSGNVYTVGYFWGTADFDPGPGTYNLTAAGGSNVFISKLDSNGNFVWAKRVGSASGFSASASVALDGSGNVYTVGTFDRTSDFDPGPGTYNMTAVGGYDVFILKLDGNGNFAWAKQLGGSSYDYGTGVAVDGIGNVYTVGTFEVTADFDPGAATANLTSAGGDDVFVSKLDTNGNYVWARGTGGASGDYATGVAVDAGGNVYTVGYFYGTSDTDPAGGVYNLTSAGNSDAFISTLDSNGNFVWAKQFGGSGVDRATGVAVGRNGFGHVYTIGYFYYSYHGVDFDPGAGTYRLTPAGGTDAFVSELDAAGNFVSAIRLGATNPCTDGFDCQDSPTDAASGVAVYRSGVLTVGNFTGTNFDPGSSAFVLSSAGGTDAFISRLVVSGSNRYYVVVPTTGNHEGSYGRNSSGVERAPGVSSCRPPSIASCP